MATRTYTIPDNKVNALLDAFDLIYEGRVEAGLTKSQWLDQCLKNYVKEIELAARQKLARTASVDSLTKDDTLIT